jgi:hypothetical protein
MRLKLARHQARKTILIPLRSVVVSYQLLLLKHDVRKRELESHGQRLLGLSTILTLFPLMKRGSMKPKKVSQNLLIASGLARSVALCSHQQTRRGIETLQSSITTSATLTIWTSKSIILGYSLQARIALN